MHECPFHVNKDHDRLAMSTITATGKDKTIFRLATNVQGWSYGAKGATKDPWGGKQGEENLCSEGCFMKEINKETAVTGVWSTAQLELLRSSAGVLKMNPRCACLITCVINKPCAEIYRQLGIENLLMPPGCQTEDQVATVEHNEPRPGTKRKKPAVSSLPGYPADCYLTHAHERRSAFQACRHLGQCTESCPCVISHVTCEKSCICSPDCPRRWRGCACKREGRACVKDSCICVKANRECDVDLCHSCGSAEALDPVNRYEERFLREGCQNVWLQRDMPKRTLLGRSAVAGFGLFVGEDVKKDAFLGEYKGEVITSDEADRRGKLYDKRGVSFLFNLNLNHVIDATRAGNKFRYVNHSKTSPNCGAKVFMVNCTHRIGMFARRDLRAGEELFFDYGYNNKQIKFVQKEFEPPEMINPSAAAGAAKKKRTRKKELEYLKGGKGTTERSRARITAAEANQAKPTQTTTLPISTAATRVRDRSGRSSESTHETTSEEDSHHQEDEVSGESVDEEYEPEPETEESLAVAELGSTADVTEIEESEEEPPRRPKRVRGRGH
ncbi:SET domain-containing protein [Morchella conica CCBAS932]|uniref:SET domain-containing protein n=1 Tax=Morchella conica CCBAS932 TaxID=1392247 RepID=A0A3N4KL85_9PEZI|nr:SET domain-containing protein [Morchella conica CCBAS932]